MRLRSVRFLAIGTAALLAWSYATIVPVSAQAPPGVTALSPTFGPTAGGNRVTVSGFQFVNVSAVLFGTTQVKQVHMVSPVQFWVSAPAHAAGVVDVKVTTPGGTSGFLPGDQYTYVAAPAVSAISPMSGSSNGGTAVSVYGSNFIGVTAVTFGGHAGSLVSVSPTSLTAVAPAHKAGPVDVQVGTVYYTSAAVPADVFTYVSPPAVTSVSPNIGPTAGGTRVTVTGSGFTGVTMVVFGGVSGSSLTVSSPTSLAVTSPPSTGGTFNVQVIGAYGPSALVSADLYTYVAPPGVTGVAPSAGGTGGGTRVTVTGTSFTAVTQVLFGAVPGGIQSVSPTSISVMSPAQGAGTVDVRVVSQFGTSSTGPGDLFTYVVPAPPAVTAIAPASGSTRGGTTVTISGGNFVDVTGVTFGGRAAGIVSVTPVSLSVMSPSHSAGPADVQVATTRGTSPPVAADVFTYVAPPTVLSISPTSGSLNGGTVVTVTGRSFANVTSVTFGGVAGTALTVTSPTSLSVTSPAHTVGSVDVLVNTQYGTSPVVAADAFTYLPPSWNVPTNMVSHHQGGPTGVSCPSSGFCVMVDDSGNMLILNGSTWSAPVQIVGPGQATVSCTSSTFCMLVDQNGRAVSFNPTGVTPPLTEDLVDSAAGLNALSCASPAFCVAGDQAGNVLTFDGTSWSSPTSIATSMVWSVSCVSSTFCVAVTDDGMARTFDGSAWSAPANLGSSGPTSVSCASPTFCVAGQVSTGDILVFDGSTWSTAFIDLNGGVFGVSCGSTAFCVAGDSSGSVVTFDGTTWSGPTAITDETLFMVSCSPSSTCAVANHFSGWALTFDGSTWSNPVPADLSNTLSGVSCTSPSFCAAVGRAGDAYTWDGTSWSAPDRIENAQLNAVSCVSPTFCVAVSQDGMAQMFDGTGWTAVQVVPMGLIAVSCASSSFCVAVHAVGDVYVWDGTSWSYGGAPDANNGPTSVSCPSSTFCMLVDNSGNALAFNGTSWSGPLTIDSPPGTNGLAAVSCSSSSFCIAVDYAGNVLTFNGAAWTAPALLDAGNMPWTVSCTSPTFCVVIDLGGNALMYDGTSWTTTDAVTGNGGVVSCTSASFCTAVGEWTVGMWR